MDQERPSVASSSLPQTTPTETSDQGGSGPHSQKSDTKPFQKGNNRNGRGDRPGKKRDMGRKEWAKTKVDKRQRNDMEQASKRQRVDKGETELPIYATKFSDDVLASEERRPKKKVAVMIGYAGTGYRGMQFTHDHKTIEGDLFKAFVEAGAISKNNADDPKKSSFVRCARTDKGVHAAGNVISLKLIVEDEDVVKKINDALVPQIRVWGYERTNNSFSAYQTVDSRIYEYLIPTHSFLPPHPSSFLGKRLEEWAEKKNDLEAYRERQAEVQGYWEKVDQEIIKPILDEYDEDIRGILKKALYLKGEETDQGKPNGVDENEAEDVVAKANKDLGQESSQPQSHAGPSNAESDTSKDPESHARSLLISEASKRLRQAYITAKRAYRIPEQRLNRIQETLNLFLGTRNFHNFTIQKSARDPSAKRVIKSFNLNKTPILINGTEWVSMKVHGQSFMMHQIRKMVGMVALIVRCGCDPKRLTESLGHDTLSIPKAPSLGLLLERPVFDSYNKRAQNELNRDPIGFDKYKDEMDKFKQEQIYERMYRDEEKENVFGNFFNHVDNFPCETFLFVTSGGIEATKIPIKPGSGQHDPKDDLARVEIDGEDSDGDETKDTHGDEG
ncbi:tRNA pseudouridine(38-40) synthase, variant [Exophiala mesophila]|uniref:tRNA pseudouridine synthase 1 n=1 Tax=Exophiala mesophila TaxID=212818 RepID=A0A0D1ZBA0_EXOME|nr:tRNA pseudouridine(38-40) synthase, variant [Exophiala mesophila]KIV91962.1 tRNA pseudouridine(38-40) synthase, variant [Exophiala mesophila]